MWNFGILRSGIEVFHKIFTSWVQYKENVVIPETISDKTNYIEKVLVLIIYTAITPIIFC